MDMINEPKQFAWSFSRLKAFEDCPRRYHETQVKKDAWPEEKSAMLEWGDVVHTEMAKALRTGEPLPTKFKQFQQWIDKVARTPGELLVEDECQWAVTRELQPCAWFAKNVWLRCVADAVKLDLNPEGRIDPETGEEEPPIALVIDWKTGKSLNGDPIQLMLTSLMMFLQFPILEAVRSDFIWLQEDSKTTQVLYKDECADRWAQLMPRVMRLESATTKQNFPPQPGRFCRRWCPVKSCEYYGK